MDARGHRPTAAFRAHPGHGSPAGICRRARRRGRSRTRCRSRICCRSRPVARRAPCARGRTVSCRSQWRARAGAFGDVVPSARTYRDARLTHRACERPTHRVGVRTRRSDRAQASLRRSQSRAPATEAAVSTPSGVAGRRTMTTGSPASRAAASLAAVAAPAAVLGDEHVDPRTRAAAPAPRRRVKGPRSSRPCPCCRGYGGCGGSTDRTRNRSRSRSREHGQPHPPGGQEHPLPRARRPAPGRRLSRDADRVPVVALHRDPAGPAQREQGNMAGGGGRGRVEAVMVSAKGWVASMSASTSCSRSQAASPCGPAEAADADLAGRQHGARDAARRGNW